MSELFDNLPELKSPHLLWMERHGVEVSGPDEDDEFEARCADGIGFYNTAYGQTETDAVRALGVKNRWKLWNEEGGTQ